ncbi:ornithine cyclodeaminase family protein [Nonomuraea sp. LP-02]|uniref:ornithine cyclodeaminase family protein n=1 Tax=Nonomuraea sp. LP-02 TaxID=3097960 RepID=UPI002E36E069|nr:ornithine cyclodeaminase family protein [Nonomuraea sp. LP-02]MED7923120.1 ornithine cyclodeaminase family protein [Nonomuraea sp. LP-02]
MTTILTRGDLLTLLDPGACLDALREGFAADPGTTAVPGQRIRTDLPFPGTATALLPGLLPGVEAYTVKVNAKFPAASPALRGVICLHDGADGELLALLDSATITAWRTGLAAALGTHALAGESDVVGVVGAGAQADLVVTGLRRLRPVSDLVVHDLSPERAAAFADRHGGRVAGSAAEVAARAGIVVLATWSRTPLLDLPDVRPGRHLTTLGVDEPGKQELSPALVRAAGVLAVDDRPLAAAMGVLAATGLPAGAAHATLGEILRGDHPGRTDPGQITVYGPVGLPWQDLALSLLAYREAGRRGVGTEIDFLA